jgi:hypothetical protein
VLWCWKIIKERRICIAVSVVLDLNTSNPSLPLTSS